MIYTWYLYTKYKIKIIHIYMHMNEIYHSVDSSFIIHAFQYFLGFLQYFSTKKKIFYF